MKLLDLLKLAPVTGKNDYLKTFDCHVYRDTICVGITNDINRVVKKQLLWFKVPEKKQDDYFADDNANAVVFDIDNEEGYGIFLLMKNEITIDELVHEIGHLAEKVLWKRDIFHSPETSEVWQYLTQYLFRTVIEVFRIDG